VVDEEQVGESKDGAGSGDHNIEYQFGNPRSRLTWHDLAKLTIMRGLVKDHTGAIEGDSDWIVTTPSGLLVPADAVTAITTDE
jgi:hypothetical protein